MGKRLPYTPNTQIKSALRRLWLRSRERANRLQHDDYTCQSCGRKQSRAKGKECKVEVHHRSGVLNWQEIFSSLRKYLLVPEEHLETLCKECHKKEGGEMKRILFLLVFLVVPFRAFSMDYQPYLYSGGMALSENGMKEGHKHFIVVGVNAIDTDKLITTLKLEGLLMAEPADEDIEMIQNGFRFGLELKENKNFTPFCGAYFNQWNRDSNPKFPFSYDRFNFADIEIGVEYSYKQFFARIGGNCPVISDHLKGRVDLITSLGYRYESIEAGIDYRKVSFSGDENNPMIRVMFPGLFLRYRF